MRRFTVLFILLPLAVVLVVLSIANRGEVTFSFDPFRSPSPGWSLTLPFFFFLFAALAIGVLVGGIATWARQGKWRQAARVERARAERHRLEAERLRERIQQATPALSPPRDRDAA
jgi:uncharacterized integral membrane protein